MGRGQFPLRPSLSLAVPTDDLWQGALCAGLLWSHRGTWPSVWCRCMLADVLGPLVSGERQPRDRNVA